MLAHLRSLVQDAAEPIDAPAPAAPVEALASMLLRARYAVIVADAEPRTPGEPRDRWGVDGLVALAEDLNAGTRCALSVLRAGGNRSGADAVLTWQTGYPAAVDFSRGVPRYRPFDGAAGARLASGETDVVLVLGAADRIPEAIAAAMTRVPLVLIGPHASAHAARAHVAFDTSVPGIHERGMVLRMDDIPLEVEAVLPGPPATAAIARDLRERIVALRHRGAAS